jgi:hypothetical protein
VNKLEDVQSLTLGVDNADICVSKLELIVNDWILFSKSYDPDSHLIGSRYPTNESWVTVTGDELRTFWRQLDASQTCAIPSGISGSALQRALTGVLGDALIEAGGSVSGSTRINSANFATATS